jgi:hypothetical protein
MAGAGEGISSILLVFYLAVEVFKKILQWVDAIF